MTTFVPGRQWNKGQQRSGAFQSFGDAVQRAIPVWFCMRCREQREAKACRCGADAVYFPSTSEFKAFQRRAMLELAGAITDLKPHPRFPCKVNGVLVCTYTADWEYRDQHGRRIIEDFKGSRAHQDGGSKVRRKLASAIYGIEITIVEK
ncbi:MAG: hypothetical protein KDB18_05770 [Salinibacterium sp.]|nr:hypothetical protein [Salinibacterium sp.]